MLNLCRIILAIAMAWLSLGAMAAPALEVLGRDFEFPHKLPDLPARLSHFNGLEINSFTTNDGVKLSYWEAGAGEPLIFVPGWSANGAQYVNLMALLARRYHVYVLDPATRGCLSTSRMAVASLGSPWT